MATCKDCVHGYVCKFYEDNAINCNQFQNKQEITPKLELSQDVTEDFTVMIYALHLLFNRLTGQKIDIIDFTHIVNKLIVQDILDEWKDEE